MKKRLLLSEVEVQTLNFYQSLCENAENEQMKLKALECHAKLMTSMLEFEKARLEITNHNDTAITKEEINREIQITKSEIEYDKEKLKKQSNAY